MLGDDCWKLLKEWTTTCDIFLWHVIIFCKKASCRWLSDGIVVMFACGNHSWHSMIFHPKFWSPSLKINFEKHPKKTPTPPAPLNPHPQHLRWGHPLLRARHHLRGPHHVGRRPAGAGSAVAARNHRGLRAREGTAGVHGVASWGVEDALSHVENHRHLLLVIMEP